MNNQKTWLQLLGRLTNNDGVFGKDICRMTGPTTRVVLWSFDSEGMAVQCFNQWMIETAIADGYGAPC